MATRADGTLPRSGKPANDAAKEAHAILVQAERGLTDSLAKPKVSNAKSLTGAFRSVSLRDATDRSVASTFAEFGEGAAEVRRLGDDGPGGKGVIRRLEGVAAMKQSRRERHESAVTAWETERDTTYKDSLKEGFGSTCLDGRVPGMTNGWQSSAKSAVAPPWGTD